MLKVENINVYYDNIHVIKNLSFDVNDGEIVTLIGANGAGKSTTLKTISGILRPKTGNIVFENEEIQSLAPHKIVSKGLVQVPEGRRMFQNLTVEENLEMGAYTLPKGEIPDMIEDIFARFPRLKERRKQVAGTLSGGEQQMLAMGRGLMSRPKLLMLDEPSMGLAPLLVDQVFDIISEMHAAGVTILLVEQNASMALQVADRGYVLETGKIALYGSGKELSESEQVKKAYLGG
ncbi:MAG: ABC transporter ATP-binding protein [Eubacteriaceae bacterium]|nr:ABC transporter ATP-binding protein [Eubacteriaceae bacterium]